MNTTYLLRFSTALMISLLALSGKPLEADVTHSVPDKSHSQRVYRGKHLDAIAFPLGGIAAGCIQIDGQARLAAWQIFNNHRPAHIPDTFFAVKASPENGRTIVRALQTEPFGPFPAMRSLSFTGEYPIAEYSFTDSALPVKVTLRAYSPLIPMNVRDSAIPCAVFSLTAANRAARRVEVSFLAAQQNAVGYTGAKDYTGRKHAEFGGNANRVLPLANGVVLHMTAEASHDNPGRGDMALLVLDDSAVGCADWNNIGRLFRDFASDEGVHCVSAAGPSPAGETIKGALSSTFRLAPGESRTTTFALCWYFPNAQHGSEKWGGQGNMYANWWPSALHVAQELASRLPELAAETHKFHDTFYSSNLPRWLLDRIISQTAVLRSKTVFWTKDGYFGGWEGCSSNKGCCQGNCSHVWHYAQSHARLFPEIGRRMREQELAFQTPDGAVPHRQLPGMFPATDGQLGTLLESYREHLLSPDRQWLHRHWPAIRKAMDYVIATWDADQDGVLSGRQWNTLDEALSGSSSWLGSLYLAALAASQRMAALESDHDTAARCSSILEKGKLAQDATLFNGNYYIQIPGETPLKDYNNGCHIDQVLGQWWAGQLDLGWVYPPEHVRTALQSLYKHSFRTSFRGITQAPRKFVSDGDAGMQMITWPLGGRPAPEHQMYYADEVMTGFEYSAAAAMIHSGLTEEGLSVLKAVSDRYDGRLRKDVSPGDNASWGYTGNPFGDDECGKFYARAMSVWSVLLACQGFVYDGPAARIGFRPVWMPENHVSFFTCAEGWGLFSQTRRNGTQTERIQVSCGKLEVESFVFELAPGFTPGTVRVLVDGKQVDTRTSLQDSLMTLLLPRRLSINAGQSAEITLM